jgi:hypothetical protein
MKTIFYVLIIGIPAIGVIGFFSFARKGKYIERRRFIVADKDDFIKALRALAESRNWKISKENYGFSIKTKRTVMSWGERISISFSGKDELEVEVVSQPRFSRTQIDNGANFRNVIMIEDLAKE